MSRGPDRGAKPAEHEVVTALLGREPRCRYTVVVRTPDARPAVLRNEPFLDDGTPMPTRYWLVDPTLVRLVSRLESAGGVKRAEAELDPEALASAHRRYAAERDASVGPGHQGPGPTGGVGGTRRGVKCLHAHYAWFLAGGDDPVGAWVHERLDPIGPPAATAGSVGSVRSVRSVGSAVPEPGR